MTTWACVNVNVWFACNTLASQDSNKPCKRKDTTDDRAGAEVAFMEDDSGEYERNVDALKEESKLEKPNSKTVRHLMKATFQGVNMWNSDILIKFHCLFTCTSMLHLYGRPQAMDLE